MEVLVIGGGAAGASCAARLRRLDENASITILEKSNEISVANCGLPYFAGGVIESEDSLYVSSVEKFKTWFNIDVKLNSEVTTIDRKNKSVTLQDGSSLKYDKLVLASGASPFVPPIEGLEKNKTFTIRRVADAVKLKEYINKTSSKKILVAGAGAIGLEMAENLNEIGLDVTIVEMQSQVLPGFEVEISKNVLNTLVENNIKVVLNDAIVKVEGNSVILNSGKKIDFDLIVMSVGVRPETGLAKDAGLKVNKGILVDKHMQTSDEDIYAAGDNVETVNYISNALEITALAGPANRQGRIIADNIAGIKSTYKDTTKAGIVKVYDTVTASVGMSSVALDRAKISYQRAIIMGRNHASYYPGSELSIYVLLFDDKGKILGAQASGSDGVDKRIDVIATAIRGNMTVYDLIDLELCYAPPFNGPKDPVNLLGMLATNILEKRVSGISLSEIKDTDLLVDVRPKEAFRASHIENAINAPITTLRDDNLDLPKDKRLVLYCNTGYTSYVSARILMQRGFTNVVTLMAGIDIYKVMNKKPESLNKKNSSNDIVNNRIVQSKDGIEPSLKINACGLSCPGPIMKVSEGYKSLNDGELMEVKCTDRGFMSDIKGWCQSTGASLVSLNNENKIITAKIGKNIQKSPVVVPGKSLNDETIIVFSNDMDKVLAALILANGALAAGKNVTLFFTFYGLAAVRKKTDVANKSFIEKMFSFMLPEDASKLQMSKFNFFGLGSLFMKNLMKKKNISSVEELLKSAVLGGAKLIACSMSMDMMGIKEEELIDGVEIGGVANYISEASKSNVNLFIG